MRLSFQSRIALLAFVSSSIIFATFAGLLLSVSRHEGFSRMQRQMRLASESVSRVAFRSPDLTTGSLLAPVLRPEVTSRLAAEFANPEYPFVIISRRGKLLYSATNCPPALAQALARSILLHEGPGDGLGPPEEREGRFGPPELDFHNPRNGFEDDGGPGARRRARSSRMNPGTAETPASPALLGAEAPPPNHDFSILPLKNQSWHVLTTRLGHHAYLLTVCDLREYTREMRVFLLAVLGAGLLGLGLLAAIGWWLAGMALHPVRALTEVASRITSRDLHQRVRVSGAAPEFAALIDVINSMLDRLERSFQQAQRFSADAAHELKTPLAILQGMADQTIRHAPVESREQQFGSDVLDEVQRLKSIVYKLLLLSQSDAGKLPIVIENVSLSDQVNLLCDDLSLIAPEVSFTSNVAPAVIVKADSSLLRQALQNLFSNAAKYNPAGGTISCVLTKGASEAVLEMGNTIAPDSMPDPERLFERFYRGDPSRNRAIEGSGLGLSLAREVMLAMGGALTVAVPAPDRILFRLTCPLAH